MKYKKNIILKSCTGPHFFLFFVRNALLLDNCINYRHVNQNEVFHKMKWSHIFLQWDKHYAVVVDIFAAINNILYELKIWH